MMIKKITLELLFTCFLLMATSHGVQPQHMDLLWERLVHYPFTGDARDISGFDNHGTVVGATLTLDVQGSPESAYAFDGMDDYIDCGDGVGSISSSVTVSCWVKIDTALENSHIVSKYNFLSDGGFILGTQNGLISWSGRIGTGQFIRMTSLSRIDDGQWHFLAGVVDGSTWLLYVDGNIENRVETGVAETVLSNTSPLTIGLYYAGDHGNHRYFKGSVDEVIIYGRALNDCELEFLFSGEPYGAR